MARNKRGQFKKGHRATRRRRRRRNPAAAPASNPPARRRRRRSSSSSAPARRRRRNPSGDGGGGRGMFGYAWRDLVPYVGASLLQAFVVRRWGDAWGTSALTGGAVQNSPYRGNAWTLKNYLIAGGTGWLGAKLIGRAGWGGAHASKVFWRATVEQLATRLLWTEVFSRWNWGHENFGQALPASAPAGTVQRDSAGNTWLMSDAGSWVSMQGYGELVQAGPLGGPNDGGYAPLSGYGELVQAGPLGHYNPDLSDEEDDTARHLGIGSRDLYAASLDAA